MQLRVEEHGDWQICFIAGVINASNSERFNELFLNMAQKCNRNLIVNLRDLEFIDSKGISTFILGKKELVKNGLKLYISNAPKPVKNILDITFLSKIIPIYDDILDIIGGDKGQARASGNPPS